jgi:hypothetical protein
MGMDFLDLLEIWWEAIFEPKSGFINVVIWIVAIFLTFWMFTDHGKSGPRQSPAIHEKAQLALPAETKSKRIP